MSLKTAILISSLLWTHWISPNKHEFIFVLKIAYYFPPLKVNKNCHRFEKIASFSHISFGKKYYYESPPRWFKCHFGSLKQWTVSCWKQRTGLVVQPVQLEEEEVLSSSSVQLCGGAASAARDATRSLQQPEFSVSSKDDKQLQQLKYGNLRSWNGLFIICWDINDNHAISHSKWLYEYLYATPQELRMLSHVTPYKLKSHYECWYCCS